MKLKDHIEQLGNNGTQVFGYAIIGSILNIISDAIDELEDEELSLAIKDLQNLVSEKLEIILNTEV